MPGRRMMRNMDFLCYMALLAIVLATGCGGGGETAGNDAEITVVIGDVVADTAVDAGDDAAVDMDAGDASGVEAGEDVITDLPVDSVTDNPDVQDMPDTSDTSDMKQLDLWKDAGPEVLDGGDAEDVGDAAEVDSPDYVCTPTTCEVLGNECGGPYDDGCGGTVTCPSCTECGEECQSGSCVFTACEGKACGDDGCGGSCGLCPEHYTCEGVTCVYVPWCGDGNCDAAVGENCGSCPVDCCTVPVDDPNELIADRHFTRGFIALEPGTSAPLGPMNPGFAPGAPVWDLAQHASPSSLNYVTPTTLPSGAKRWEDQYGAVTIGPYGSAEADLSLRIQAFEVYGGTYYTPTATKAWVHLLGAQLISAPGAVGPGCPPLPQLASLDFSVDARLLYDQQNIQAGYDPGKHTSSYLMYFTIQNLSNPGAPGYGDYLWFGVTLYDDRYPMPGLYAAQDSCEACTGKYIYNIGLEPLSNSSLNDQQWHSLSADLLPHILTALQKAWDLGYLPDSQNLADYRIGGMNLGWEIPGLNNSELQIRDLSLIYTESIITEVVYGFNSDGDTEGWTTKNIDQTFGGPSGGLWVMTVPGSDPIMLSPALQLNAGSYSTFSVTMANDGNPAPGSHMQVFWKKNGEPDFSEANSAWIAVYNHGGWATYTIDLAAHPNWSGQINQFRIDPIMYGDGHAIGVDAIVIAP